MATLLLEHLPLDTLKIVDSFLCNLKKHHTPNTLASRGSLKGLMWLHKYRPTSFIRQTPMRFAAQKGYLHIVQWLYSHNYSDTNSITYAAIGGHSDIITWLRYKGFMVTQLSVITSISYKHFDLGLTLLCDYFEQPVTAQLDTMACLTVIAKNGFVLAFDWFINKFPHTEISHDDANKLITLSVRNGRFSMTRRLHREYDAQPLLYSIDYAIRRGALDVVQYCLENGLDELSQFSVSDAITNGHYRVVQYINPRSIDNWAFNIACMKGHVRLIKWIFYTYPRCIDVKKTLTLMKTKMYSNPNKDVIGWLQCVA